MRELDIKPGISACLTNLANTYNEIKEYDKAIRYHEQALELKMEMGDNLGEARVLNNLGVVYNNMEQYPTAENYFNQASALAKKVNETILLNEIEYGLAVSAFGNGFYEQSVKMANRVLANLD